MGSATAQDAHKPNDEPGITLSEAVAVYLRLKGANRPATFHRAAERSCGHPKAFVLLIDGKLKVHFRTAERPIPWAECRAMEGQDCMPVTAAILAGREIRVRATCTAPCSWIELPPADLVELVHGNPAFRRALFAAHAGRLPAFFARLSSRNVISIDRLIADWLLGHARAGEVLATHAEIARDLLTAREVVTRRLRDFATKGWIVQRRGLIRLDAPAALRRLSQGRVSVRVPNPEPATRLPA